MEMKTDIAANMTPPHSQDIVQMSLSIYTYIAITFHEERGKEGSGSNNHNDGVET